MSPDAAKYLWDVEQAAAKTLRFVQGKSFDDYMADELLRSAVERQLEIVVGADAKVSHRTDRILSQGWKPTLRWSAVDECSCQLVSWTSSMPY